MIPVQYIRIGIEKQAINKPEMARKSIKWIGKGISGIAKVVAKHPIVSTAVIGAGIGTATLANKALGTYVIFNEQRKRGIMLNQTKLMQQIADATNRPALQSDINPSQNDVSSVAAVPLY